MSDCKNPNWHKERTGLIAEAPQGKYSRWEYQEETPKRPPGGITVENVGDPIRIEGNVVIGRSLVGSSPIEDNMPEEVLKAHIQYLKDRRVNIDEGIRYAENILNQRSNSNNQ